MKKIITLSSIVLLSTMAIAPSVQAEEKPGATNYSNGLVKFRPNTDITNPVNPINPGENIEPIDPTDPEGKPSPGTNGPLSIDFVSSLDFGYNKISSQDQTYYARAQRSKTKGDKEVVTPNYVQVTDGRGTNGGWTLSVKQNGQFKAVEKDGQSVLNNILTGAAITFDQASTNSESTSEKPDVLTEALTLDAENEAVVPFFSAKKDTGSGTWVNMWGTVESIEEENDKKEMVNVDVTKAISLFVPGSTAKDSVEYRTELVWSLSDVPGR